MAGMDWFRWHHGSVTDPKFQLIAKQAGASVAEVLAVWACLLEAASQAEQRGNPGAPDFEAMDCALGLDDGKASAIYEKMLNRGLLTEFDGIAAWDKRQPKREREDNTNAERQRAFKAKRNQVTPDNATGNQKTPREEKSREEKKEKTTPSAFVLPDWIPAETWGAYLAVRKTKRAGQDPSALALIVKDLVKFQAAGHDPVAILETSIKSAWVGVFEPKARYGQSGSGNLGGSNGVAL